MPDREAHPRNPRYWLLLGLSLLVVALAVLLLLGRGTGAGARIAEQSPAPGAQDVPGSTSIRLRFEAPMDTTALPTVVLSPPVTGTVRWEDANTLSWRPASPLLPETTYQVEFGGLQDAEGNLLRRAVTWQFTTRALRVLSLGWDEQDRIQLYMLDPHTGSSQQLSRAPRRVVDYAQSPDGRTIVFSSERADGGSDLWQVPVPSMGQDVDEAGQVLDCGGDYCAGPVWAPDGQRLLYERRAIGEPGATPDPPRLWWLAPASGQTTPLFSDDQLLGHAPRFSNDGSWLALIVPLVQAIQMYSFETGDFIEIPNEVGEPVAWHPWRNTFLTNNITYQGESFSVHLFRVALPGAQQTNLSGDLTTNDASPAWSPDGQWIVFGRRLPRTPQGRQLWLMRADGSQSQALTDDRNSNFGRPSWSPDGNQLLVQRFRVNEPNSDPGIWLVDSDDGELHEVATSGFQPGWLP